MTDFKKGDLVRRLDHGLDHYGRGGPLRDRLTPGIGLIVGVGKSSDKVHTWKVYFSGYKKVVYVATANLRKLST